MKISPALLALALFDCGPSASEIREMKQWSASARSSCAVPGQCPESEKCIRGVVDATNSPPSRNEYQNVRASCWQFGGVQ